MADRTAFTAETLAELYAQSFGGKSSGRYRIPQKLLREMLGVRRLYSDDIVGLTRALFEKGYVLIDMDSFYVVMSANSFVNYRRLSNDAIKEVVH
ncbi:hypothetical protein [Actibacterium lipolyticum]|uniref:Uncharacterized protein n=1 Tax=Actibacterium lipolyticum TaxID=1524263 RepID=A0A238KH72_9RHOB|nr:hypothetical protein [Actibacterium lipolyticum]SMX41452.1 hypothetical protein COL8621_01758 [Actibacterium lipolyticum]